MVDDLDRRPVALQQPQGTLGDGQEKVGGVDQHHDCFVVFLNAHNCCSGLYVGTENIQYNSMSKQFPAFCTGTLLTELPRYMHVHVFKCTCNSALIIICVHV